MSYIDELSKTLNCTPKTIISGYIKAPKKYKVFFIKKKNGKGLREIAQPSPDVKKVQRAIVNSLLSLLPVHECATAYIEEKSIVDNAEPHKKNEYILKMDFENFFYSIKPQDLNYFISKNDIQLNQFEYEVISHYLFRRKKGEKKLRLCIGAPSSPMISNIVMYDFDEKLFNYCKENDVIYTRYADDLSFSSDSFDKLNDVKNFVINLVSLQKKPELIINTSKTKFIGKGRSRRITGVVISNTGDLGVGRFLRKKIRALFYLYSNNKINHKDIPYLLGMLSHIKSIEPDYYYSLIKINGEDKLKQLGKDSFAVLQKNND
ncbi:RNA-directed DNA polymerase [Hafnia alvei]|uniref:retron St85 family RNA-directed DNA polymerase n=1 Tax=Hafnia alvei TaxID=569 RepID=UPI00103439BE|nr:retron St85 family RNA-directed DNA polymerase [Hafnia alvei]TBL85779.1 RNA-directed DNA polymerase [Hafnia alvei]